MSHQHHAVHFEARAPQEIVKVTEKVTVTATGPPPVSTPTEPTPVVNNYPETTSRNGPPVARNRHPSSQAPVPTHHPVYHHHTESVKQSSHYTKSYHAPTRHHRPPLWHTENSRVHSKTASHYPENTHIAPPKSINHHDVGKPIVAAPSSAPSNGAVHEHGSDQLSTSKLSTDQGMSGGAKAGLAVGILLAIGLVAGLLFFFYRKKKQNQNRAHQPLDDEKTDLNKFGSLSSHVSVRRNNASAPRLSLRPVTQMFPIMAEKQDNNAASTLIANSAASARARTPEPQTTFQHNDDQSNPFGDHAEAANTADDSAIAAPAAVVPKPLSIKSERTGTGISERSMPVAAAATAGANVQNPRRLSPPGAPANNVHRVQLDFNPSMDDELGLRAGQLVRMLHEYDDGWALCVRLDRSQQGVVPRTCLSKLPVKPRPQGPPQGTRGPPPQGRPRGSSNAPASRMPPNGRLRSQSNSPRQQQPEFAGPMSGRPAVHNARPRANSDAMSARRVTPPNMTGPGNSTSTSPTQTAGVPSRKPVPGQAL